MKPPTPRLDAEEHIHKVRQICTSLPGTTEKLSHGEPTFFVAKKVFTMVANNHHNDGHIAVWIPAPPGLQQHLIASAPEIYFKPPYVGVRGWIGIELSTVDNDTLGGHIFAAWQLIAPQKLQALRL
ncbi:MAG: uncharacterized protein JWM43_3033 [Acidobacteriaceae bacterium]|nr:uncharacterized protein [Acidobacteriaceae bacterium]